MNNINILYCNYLIKIIIILYKEFILQYNEIQIYYIEVINKYLTLITVDMSELDIAWFLL